MLFIIRISCIIFRLNTTLSSKSEPWIDYGASELYTEEDMDAAIN